MHAVVVRVTVNDVEPAVKELNEETIPRVKQAPGFVAGYWTRGDDDTGLAMIVFESEEAAKGSSERLRENPPTHITIEGVEMREVVGSA